MKRPSRLMPARSTRPTTWWGWLFAAALIGAWSWAVSQRPVTVLCVTTLGGAIGLVSGWYDRSRLKSVAAQRVGESICTFTRALPWHEVDPWVVRAVYEELQAQVATAVPAFPLRPSDELYRDLRFDADDLDMEIAPDIARRCNRDLSRTSENPLYGRVVTVGDLVQFMCAQPQGAAQQSVQADEVP